MYQPLQRMATDWNMEFDIQQRHKLLLSITVSIPDVYYRSLLLVQQPKLR
jgi:hypothetical protein